MVGEIHLEKLFKPEATTPFSKILCICALLSPWRHNGLDHRVSQIWRVDLSLLTGTIEAIRQFGGEIVLHCEGCIADLRYRWLITSGSARWLIEILSAILKSTRHGGQSTCRKTIAFWGTTRSPAFTMHKFMSETLRVNTFGETILWAIT